MKTPHGSPVVLHVEVGPAVLKTILDRLGGAQAWNRWLAALRDGGHLGGAWGEGEPEPPLCFWFEVGGDFAGRNLDGIELWGIVSCDGIRIDGGSAVGATIGSCVRGSFRDADLRRAAFVDSVSGADFTAADVRGASFDEATFDPEEPPVGLPDALLRACRAESGEEPAGAEPPVGLVEHPVVVRATLAASATER